MIHQFLSPEIIAQGTKELLEIAEESAKKYGFKLIYVVGTDVPIAGGGEEEGITKIEDFQSKVYICFKKLFS